MALNPIAFHPLFNPSLESWKAVAILEGYNSRLQPFINGLDLHGTKFSQLVLNKYFSLCATSGLVDAREEDPTSWASENFNRDYINTLVAIEAIFKTVIGNKEKDFKRDLRDLAEEKKRYGCIRIPGIPDIFRMDCSFRQHPFDTSADAERILHSKRPDTNQTALLPRPRLIAGHLHRRPPEYPIRDCSTRVMLRPQPQVPGTLSPIYHPIQQQQAQRVPVFQQPISGTYPPPQASGHPFQIQGAYPSTQGVRFQNPPSRAAPHRQVLQCKGDLVEESRDGLAPHSREPCLMYSHSRDQRRQTGAHKRAEQEFHFPEPAGSYSDLEGANNDGRIANLTVQRETAPPRYKAVTYYIPDPLYREGLGERPVTFVGDGSAVIRETATRRITDSMKSADSKAFGRMSDTHPPQRRIASRPDTLSRTPMFGAFQRLLYRNPDRAAAVSSTAPLDDDLATRSFISTMINHLFRLLHLMKSSDQARRT